MKPEIIVIYSLFIGFALLEAIKTGFFRKQGARRVDGIVEIFSAVVLLALIQPTILMFGAMLTKWVAPQLAGVLAGLPFVVGFLVLLVLDDFLNYWWHRNAHMRPRFYKLHRPHHEGEYMSVRIVFRNGIFYYLLAPYYWLSGVLIFMGLGWVYAFYLAAKAVIIFSSHSDVPWDKPLYANKWTSPLMWVVERVIVTPAFHHAHHGKFKADGVTNYKGNFGNFLSLWDVIFRTAKITRQYPEAYGIEELPPTTIGEQLFWPLVVSSPAVVQTDHLGKTE